MQKCLQKKNKIHSGVKLFLITSAAVALVTAAMVYGTDTQETTLFGAKYGKYLSVAGVSKASPEKQSEDASDDEKTKMNNFGFENAKSVETAIGTSETAGSAACNLTGRFSDTITVYLHQTKETVQMKLEEYVVGVVLSEMPSSFSPQALMAQAVAVRSFTCYKMQNGGLSSHGDAAVCTDYRHCQSYISPAEYEKKGDYAKDALLKIREAVDATRGICAVYDSQPIMAVYHASSGTGTKNSEAVWGGKVPYLVGVEAAEDKSVCSANYKFSYGEIEKRLSDEKGAVSCFSVLGRAVSQETDQNGLVTSMSFSGRSFDRKEISDKLGLRSEEFSANLSEDSVTFTAYGYGHRVGMSQYGADALAKQGYGFMDILKYYYNGVGFSYVY